MQILEDEQDRRPASDTREQVGNGGVEAMALGVGVGDGRGGQPADSSLEVRQHACQLASNRSEVLAQLGRIGVPHEVVERLDEGPVRSGDDGVAASVEDDRPVRGNLVRQLPEETALAGPRLAGEQRRATALGFRARHQRPERSQLARAPHKREGRSEPERSRKREHH